MREVDKDMQRLGITWKVAVVRRSDVSLELQVARTKSPLSGKNHDLISLADVGLGTAQVLPVVAALHAAAVGQLVYIEQPELHLHPNAQVGLAEIVARAVKRGVRVVVETHSSLLLLGIQIQLAQGGLDAEDVRLHWFLRNGRTGKTEIETADLHQDGTFGGWPVDFDEIQLRQQSEFMTALEKQHARRRT
jgi:predicted ATPase